MTFVLVLGFSAFSKLLVIVPLTEREREQEKERIIASGAENEAESPVSFPPLRPGKGVTDLKPANVQGWLKLLEG